MIKSYNLIFTIYNLKFIEYIIVYTLKQLQVALKLSKTNKEELIEI